MKMGVEYNYDLEASLFDAAARGIYVFNNLAAFVADNPFVYEAQIDPTTGQDITTSPNNLRVWTEFLSPVILQPEVAS